MTTLQFLAEWALRSSILILSGALLLRALRVKDPSIRLAAWTAMLCGSLAIPALTAALPRVPLTMMRGDVWAARNARGPRRRRAGTGAFGVALGRWSENASHRRFRTVRLGAPPRSRSTSLSPLSFCCASASAGDVPASAAQQPRDRSNDGEN